MTGVFVVTLNAASPVRLASAPRIGVLVVRANVADPRPLIEAVSSGVFVERVKVTLPLPETISSPSGVLVVMLKLVDPSPGSPLMPVAVAALAHLSPATLGIHVFVPLNQMGATLGDLAPRLAALTVLALGYVLWAAWRSLGAPTGSPRKP